jgi:hypothetical protein
MMCCGFCTIQPMQEPTSLDARARALTADGKVHIADVPRSEWVIVQRMVHEGMGEKSHVSPWLLSFTEGVWPG